MLDVLKYVSDQCTYQTDDNQQRTDMYTCGWQRFNFLQRIGSGGEIWFQLQRVAQVHRCFLKMPVRLRDGKVNLDI